ncbi:hypothetical protein CCDG5_1355 [[Clostridium] cellulosi]|uniref:Permease n=1 Tax=[Clostridium] cellulosi TaxID=29343 RepID=A0A078KTN7_9FIRM|nr:hypothetical protein CCDG5_1355 [[Clostridium] cellulosi]
MENILTYLKKPIVKRLFILALIGFALYLMRGMITLFLLTFIFIYLTNAAQKFIYIRVHRFIPIKRSYIIAFIYLLVAALLVLIACIYIPQIISQMVELTKIISNSVTKMMNEKTTGNDMLDNALALVKNIDLQKYVEKGGNALVAFIGNVGSLGFDIFMALILSLFFMLQKSRVYSFIVKFKNSKISWLYEELKYFGLKFTNTFGKVLQTQILISFINSILSMILLSFFHFPSILGLGVMIFILGIIPVAGVFISLVPLSIIAYSIGGWKLIIYVLVMIAILHAIEAYILNPKLMSEKVNLPIFFTFLIITISGHFFGAWGMLVGIPVFMFILDILGVDVNEVKKSFRDKIKPAKELNEKQS